MASALQEKLEYRKPLEQSDIAYFIVDTKKYKPKSLSDSSYSQLCGDIIESAKKEITKAYGTKFHELKKDTVFSNSRINYFLVGLFDPTLVDIDFKENLLRMKSAPNCKLNLAAIYEKKSAAEASEIIRKLDNDLGVNTIYQDNTIKSKNHEYLTVSNIDVADNMVCETFRIKYQPVKDTKPDSIEKLNEARNEAWPNVLKMQEIYKKYHLWHRSPYDGAFMFLTKNGWLATATRTPKNNVQKEDLSLILNFNEKDNSICYVGDRLPSSDLPEFLVLVKRNEEALAKKGETLPVIKYVAHFHKNEITRNPVYKKYGVPFCRYGVFESGRKLSDLVIKRNKATDGINVEGKGRGFIILEHGLVRMGVKLKHLEEFLQLFDIE